MRSGAVIEYTVDEAGKVTNARVIQAAGGQQKSPNGDRNALQKDQTRDRDTRDGGTRPSPR
jgi:hypothetical protein